MKLNAYYNIHTIISRNFEIFNSMTQLNLKIDSLAYTCYQKNIIDDVNYELTGNQVVALLGPNGAGKSTLLKALSSQLSCTQGSIKFNDFDSQTDRKKYLNELGYMPEVACFFPELNVMEQLSLFAENFQIIDKKQRLEEMIELCGLNTVINKRMNKLSLGYKQRVNLAQALLNQPKLLLLDEPLNGLDPSLIIEFRDIIKNASDSSIVFLSTHILSEAELINDTVLIMNHGKLIHPDSANSCTQKWQAKFASNITEKLKSKLSFLIGLELNNSDLYFQGDKDIAQRLNQVVSNEDNMYHLAPVSSKLEMVYKQYTSGEFK